MGSKMMLKWEVTEQSTKDSVSNVSFFVFEERQKHSLHSNTDTQ